MKRQVFNKWKDYVNEKKDYEYFERHLGMFEDYYINVGNTMLDSTVKYISAIQDENEANKSPLSNNKIETVKNNLAELMFSIEQLLNEINNIKLI